MRIEVELNPKLSLQDNATIYYEKAKKLKRKLKGIQEAIEKTKQLIEEEKNKEKEQQKLEKKIQRKKEWYESFHWMKLNDFLVIGGRDSKSNTRLVKNYLEDDDLFFHADVTGASVVIAKKGKQMNEKQLQAVAQFAASFSRAWKAGRGAVDVYAVEKSQVKTAAKSGEYLSAGSFVIEGRRKWFRNTVLELKIGFNEEEKLMIAPPLILKKGIVIVPDLKSTKGNSAKIIYKKLKELFPKKNFDINWVQELLPNGGSKIPTNSI
jgi:predicted ribosome quality control (RQC) complex YloA/Tae2 family protein